jgi:hypothetical protein
LTHDEMPCMERAKAPSEIERLFGTQTLECAVIGLLRVWSANRVNRRLSTPAPYGLGTKIIDVSMMDTSDTLRCFQFNHRSSNSLTGKHPTNRVDGGSGDSSIHALAERPARLLNRGVSLEEAG